MSRAVTDGRGAALIVAADREDRRVLFDALDAQAFEAIYSARDVESTDDRAVVEATRSEERRVVKECRSRWSPYH